MTSKAQRWTLSQISTLFFPTSSCNFSTRILDCLSKTFTNFSRIWKWKADVSNFLLCLHFFPEIQSHKNSREKLSCTHHLKLPSLLWAISSRTYRSRPCLYVWCSRVAFARFFDLWWKYALGYPWSFGKLGRKNSWRIPILEGRLPQKISDQFEKPEIVNTLQQIPYD